VEITTWKDELSLLLVGAGVVALLGTSINRAKRVMEEPPPARVTPWAAMRIANDQVHGKPISATYTREDDHWRYDVTIAKDKALRVVAVDANTGKAGKAEVSTPGTPRAPIGDTNQALGKRDSNVPTTK
jgi:hypothetical protein